MDLCSVHCFSSREADGCLSTRPFSWQIHFSVRSSAAGSIIVAIFGNLRQVFALLICTTTMRRALLTETERERLSNSSNAPDQRVYESVSRVRRRINKELPRDIEILRKHRPDLYEELQTVVCENTESAENER